jgi:hypothetical protein
MYIGRYENRYFRVHKKNLENVPSDFVVSTDRKAARFYNQKTGALNTPCSAYEELKTPDDFIRFRNRSEMNINLLFGMYNGR